MIEVKFSGNIAETSNRNKGIIGGILSGYEWHEDKVKLAEWITSL